MIVHWRRGARDTEFLAALDSNEFSLVTESVRYALEHYEAVGDYESLREILSTLDDPTLIKNPEHTGTRRRGPNKSKTT